MLLEGKKFRLERRQIPLRDGGTQSKLIIVHPGSVVLLPVTPDGDLVLIRNYRHAVGKTLWELPAGTMEPPEPADLCAARELEEEAGYVADRVELIGSFYAAPGSSTELMHAYLATGLTKTEQRLEQDEDIEVHVLTEQRVVDMIRSGEISDGKTVATLSLWKLQQS